MTISSTAEIFVTEKSFITDFLETQFSFQQVMQAGRLFKMLGLQKLLFAEFLEGSEIR